MMDTQFQTKITQYLDHIRADYEAWGKPDLSDPIKAQVRREMIERFSTCLGVERGSKYLKVVSDGGVHSFVVIKADGKFAVGDILKAASWATPARNFKRGNILTGDWSNITWTGAH